MDTKKNIIIEYPNKVSLIRASFLLNDFKLNDYNIIFKSHKDNFKNSLNCYPLYICLFINNKKIFIEWMDFSYIFFYDALDNYDYYFKLNMLTLDDITKISNSNELFKKDIYKNFLTTYKKYSHKLRGFPMTRCNSEMIITPKIVKTEKKYIFITYTKYCTYDKYSFNVDFRIKIYKLLKKILGNKFKLYEAKNPTDNLSYDKYIEFLNQGYFMLYFNGKGYGMPYRLCDAYNSQTVATGSYIYNKYYNDYPLLDLNWRDSENLFDEEKTIKQINHIANNYKDIYNSYLEKQNKWYIKKVINYNIFQQISI